MFRRFVALFVVGVVSIVAMSAGVVSAVDADEPALEVNDEVITMEDFEQRVDQQIQRVRQQMSQMQGNEPSEDELEQYRGEIESQVVERLRTRLVLTEAAEERDVEVSEEEVDQSWQQITDQFPSEDALDEALEEQGETRESVREDLREQVKIQNFIDQEIGEVDVSEEEARDFFEQNSGQFQQQGESVEFSDVREQIVQTLQQQRQRERTEELVEELEEEEVDVTVYVDASSETESGGSGQGTGPAE